MSLRRSTGGRAEDTSVAPAGARLVECVDVARTFGSGPMAVVAVHDVRCTVTAGARIALTGPSGSGKSTLLHLIAGLDEPTRGTITWSGLGGGPLARPGLIGVIFQGPSLIPNLDVAENVALPLRFAGVLDGESTARAMDALAQLGLSDLAPRLPDELSGGQAQRVAVARAVAGDPKLIVADEPTGQLDHEAGGHVISVLVAAAEKLGTALIVTTHDPRVAARLPERWTMRDGSLTEQDG